MKNFSINTISKKYLLGLAALTVASGASAWTQALYVKRGDEVAKYKFGVAGDLNFTENGHKLQVSGYSDVIDLDAIDGIWFNAPQTTALTPEAQKQKLVDVGQELYKLVNMKSVEGMLRMHDAFFMHHEGQCPPSEYEVPEEYWAIHGEVRNVIRAAKEFASGNPAAVRTLRAKTVNLYKMQDYFGIYAPNYSKETWVKQGPADYLEVQFSHPADKNHKYAVRLEVKEQGKVWKTPDAEIEWPGSFTVTFYADGVECGLVKIDTELVQDEKIVFHTDVKTGDYHAVSPVTIVNDLITENTVLDVNGKKTVTASAVINGANLLDYAAMKEAIKESLHYHNADGDCCGEDPSLLVRHIFRATAEADVLGQLQAKGVMHDFDRLNEVLNEDDDAYVFDGGTRILTMNADKSIITLCYDNPEDYTSELNYYNDYIDAQFYYDGSKKTQGYLAFELVEDGWESPQSYDKDWDGHVRYAYVIENGRLYNVWWNGEAYVRYSYEGDNEVKHEYTENQLVMPNVIKHLNYEIQPVLLFPDGTSYVFGDFFDEDSFRKILDDVDEIIDVYDSFVIQDTPSERW